MPRQDGTEPFDDGPDGALDTDDVTLLLFMAVGALFLGAILWLGLLCATHRIEAVLAVLHP